MKTYNENFFRPWVELAKKGFPLIHILAYFLKKGVKAMDVYECGLNVEELSHLSPVIASLDK